MNPADRVAVELLGLKAVYERVPCPNEDEREARTRAALTQYRVLWLPFCSLAVGCCITLPDQTQVVVRSVSWLAATAGYQGVNVANIEVEYKP